MKVRDPSDADQIEVDVPRLLSIYERFPVGRTNKHVAFDNEVRREAFRLGLISTSERPTTAHGRQCWAVGTKSFFSKARTQDRKLRLPLWVLKALFFRFQIDCRAECGSRIGGINHLPIFKSGRIVPEMISNRPDQESRDLFRLVTEQITVQREEAMIAAGESSYRVSYCIDRAMLSVAGPQKSVRNVLHQLGPNELKGRGTVLNYTLVHEPTASSSEADPFAEGKGAEEDSEATWVFRADTQKQGDMKPSGSVSNAHLCDVRLAPGEAVVFQASFRPEFLSVRVDKTAAAGAASSDEWTKLQVMAQMLKKRHGIALSSLNDNTYEEAASTARSLERSDVIYLAKDILVRPS